ncbi:hypothetical protein Tco_1200433 [Tanacetum coccineum]
MIYKGLNVIIELLKDISNAVKDDPATKQKLNEAIETFARISSNVTEVLSLVKGFDFSTLLSAVKSLRAHTGENANTTATEEPPSHTKGETEEPRLAILISSIPSTVIPPTQAQPITSIIIHPKSSQATLKIDKGKGIATESDDDPSKKLVKASSIVHHDPDEPVIVEFIINGRTVYLTEQEIQDYWDKEEQIKKAEEEARLNAISKPEKAQDAEYETVCSRLKPEPITNIKMHPKTKLVVITVYRGTAGRNFDVHKPFLFGAFGISELDELREIIPKKKNTVVKDLMNSLSFYHQYLCRL